jgi:hypothetical protein
MAANAELCGVCQLFSFYSFQQDVEEYRGYAFDKVVEGTKDGCRFCTMLYYCFRAVRTDEPYIHLKLHQTPQSNSSALGIEGMVATLGGKTAFKRNGAGFRQSKLEDVYMIVVADPGQSRIQELTILPEEVLLT